MAERPKNKLILEAPWLVHLPKFVLGYALAVLCATHDVGVIRACAHLHNLLVICSSYPQGLHPCPAAGTLLTFETQNATFMSSQSAACAMITPDSVFVMGSTLCSKTGHHALCADTANKLKKYEQHAT